MEPSDEFVPIPCKEEELQNDSDIEKQLMEMLTDIKHSPPISEPVVMNKVIPIEIEMEITNIREEMDPQRIILSHSLSMSPSVLRARSDNEPVEYRINQDVLVRHPDGRLYLGTVIGMHDMQYQVQYDDNRVEWTNKDALNKLDSEDARMKDSICTICDERKSTERTRNCCFCLRGFHTSCLPFDERLIIIQSKPWFSDWHCKDCHEKVTPEERTLDYFEERDVLNKRIQMPRMPIWPEGLEPLTDRSQLPYIFDRLIWDPLHRVNTSGQYCYCGTFGLWKREMIMCRRCKQWFHSHCIKSLQFPIFLGDPFYFFLCSICNHGHEFVRRLEISWRDLVHLVLYNLIMRTDNRYFSAENAIAPYIEENLRTLQLPDHILRMTVPNRLKSIIKTLRKNKESFKHLKTITEGNEFRGVWSLKHNFPPDLQLSDVPQDNIITEQSLKSLGSSDRSVRFITRSWIERSLVNDVECRELMQGLKYACDSPSPTDFVRESSDTDSSQDSELSSSSPMPDLDQEMEAAASNIKQRRGKKSNPLLRQKTRGRKATLLGRNGHQGTTQENFPIQLPPLDELIPRPTNYEGKNNPFHPLFMQKSNRDAPPTISDLVKPSSSSTAPLPSGSKRRKCYRQPIEYHLHNDTTKEEPNKASIITNSDTSTKHNNDSSAVGNCEEFELFPQKTVPTHMHKLRERTCKINYSLTRTYKRRASLCAESATTSIDMGDSHAMHGPKRRHSVCVNSTKIAESQPTGMITRRMSMCADLFRNNNESIELHLNQISTKGRPKAERSNSHKSTQMRYKNEALNSSRYIFL
ncbi:polycomb protein Pcl [Anopheles darlingi]|uniref:polycomb protein Pcl n=1 Tax=Anopheles darlingi TaxID=43151 RepID=UPI0021003182|nr:polycomb protein Pcl [Anopheles darlingi]